MTKELRSRKFINGWAQIRIAVEVLLHSLLMITMLFWILFAPPFVTAFSSYGVLDHQAVAKDLVILNASKWPLFILLAIFVGMISILFSHHIVGPAVQIKRVMKEISERNLTSRIKFRKWDYMIEVEENFNQAIARLKEDTQTLVNATDRASSVLRDLRPQVGNSEKLDELDKLINQLSTLGKSYQL